MQESRHSFFGWKETLCVLSGLTAVLLPMEWRWPYYFLQDDNRDYFLPYLVHNWRSLLEGQFPLYNFHQYSGIPGGGLSESFFVPAYLATFLSQRLFGHPFAAIDFLAIGHLALGALGWLAFFRSLGLRRAAAVFGALAAVLNAFMIYGSASWVFVAVVGACFAWMLFFGLAFLRRPSAANFLGLITAHLWLFYAGYPQYFLYASGFEVLLLAGFWLTGVAQLPSTGRLAQLLQYCAAWIYVALLAAPMLLPLWRQMVTSEHRRAALNPVEFLSYFITPLAWIAGLLNPFTNDAPKNIGDSLRFLPHVGYLTIVLAGGAACWALTGKLDPVRRRLAFAMLGMAVLTIALSMGLFASWLYRMPLYNRFRWPFKYLLFGNTFMVMLAALALDHFLENVVQPVSRRTAGALCLVLCIVNFLVLYTAVTPKPFRTFYEPIPLEEPLKEKLGDGKIFTLGYPWGYRTPAPSLGFDYATLWGLYHFAGYDPLVPEANHSLALRLDYFSSFEREAEFLPWDRLRRWGVRWYVVGNEIRNYDPALLARGLAVIHRDAQRTVFRDPLAQPLVFWEDGGTDPVESRITTNNIQVRTQRPEAGRLCLNFLWKQRFEAQIDGQPSLLESNPDGQMTVNVPAGRHSILVEYRDPDLKPGVWLALAGAALALLHAIILRRHPAMA